MDDVPTAGPTGVAASDRSYKTNVTTLNGEVRFRRPPRNRRVGVIISNTTAAAVSIAMTSEGGEQDALISIPAGATLAKDRYPSNFAQRMFATGVLAVELWDQGVDQ